MSYLSLYRKYRPQTFSDVAGQAHIVDVLTNQLANGKLGHAYIFSGTRGTGKTSCAKILARAVNCENPINGNPCNKCRNCLGISDGSILDVTEMDAASNNGVDDVRLLTQEAAYLPSSAKKRVYIIDEVHMLSKGAFNALLKTLEEPPEHVLFILATTELHKVPATIQSRCQTFLFRRISKEIIAERLLEVSAAEQIKLEPSAAAVLARLADGAMRDALSLLERVAGSEIITRETIEQQLGLASGNAIRELYNAAVSGASAAALSLLDRLYREGSDVGAILSQLAAYVRDSLVLSACGAEASPLLSGEYEAAELDLGDSVKLRNIAALLQMTAGELDRSPDRKSAAELLLLQLGGTKLPQNPQTEYKPAQPQAPQAPYVPNSGTSVNVNSGAIRAALAPVSQQSTQQAESTVQTAAPQPSTLDWSKIAAAIAHKVNPLLAKELKNGRDITAEASGDTLNLIVSHPFMEMQITDPDVLSSIAAAAAGQSANPVTILINSKPIGTVTEPTASVQDLKQFGDLVKFD